MKAKKKELFRVSILLNFESTERKVVYLALIFIVDSVE